MCSHTKDGYRESTECSIFPSSAFLSLQIADQDFNMGTVTEAGAGVKVDFKDTNKEVILDTRNNNIQ
jgi:hypothetical protein